MNNEEKILEVLSKMQGDIAGIKGTLENVEQLSQRTVVLLESEYRDKLQLLFDGHSLIEEKLDGLSPKSRVDELEEEVDFLRSVVKSMSKRLDALEKAQ